MLQWTAESRGKEMYWIVMDSTIELILLFYTFTSLNNNRILLLIVKKGSEFYHSQFHILENRDTNFTDTNFIQRQKPFRTDLGMVTVLNHKSLFQKCLKQKST